MTVEKPFYQSVNGYKIHPADCFSDERNSMRIIVLILFTGVIFSQVVFREDFRDLDDWEPLNFPKIERHTDYRNEQVGERSVLSITSNASASGLIWKENFNVYESPVLHWSWRVENVFQKGNALSKEGDDYPLRIYVIFQYDPESAGFFDSILYESAKLIYGDYPPHSSLNYIWANRPQKENIIPNAYTDKAMMFVLEEGADHTGKWREYTVNILEDYRKAFGEDPPATASLAIMSDSDNTGERARAYVDYIEVLKK